MLLTEVTAASKIAERTPDRLAGAETCTEFKYISTHAGTWQAGRQAGIWRSRCWHERRPTSPTTHPHSGRLPSSAKAPRRLEMRGAQTEDPQQGVDIILWAWLLDASALSTLLAYRPIVTDTTSDFDE